MRRDIEFASGGETVRGWLYTPDDGDGPFPAVVMAGGWCYVKELVQPHVAQQFADCRARGDPLRLPQLRVERRSAPSAHRPERADRGLPERDLLRRDARRGRLRQDRRVGALLQRRPRADPRCNRPAREVRLGADSGRRRLSQHATRPRNDRLPPVRAAAAGRPASRASPAARTDSCPTRRPIRPRRSRPGPSPRRTRRSASSSSARPRPTRTGARSSPPSC